MKKIGLLAVSFIVMPFLANCGGDKPAPVGETYTVTWKNDDGTILEVDEKVEKGSIPQYDGEEPTKKDTKQYVYTFKGWDGDITQPVVTDTTFTAQYNSECKKYSVKFVNDNGSTLYTQKEVPFDGKTKIKYQGETPQKEPTAQQEYTFAGWNPELKEDTVITDDLIDEKGEITYTATYTQSTRKYNITFKDYDETVLDTHEVEFGLMPEYKGVYPTRPMSKNIYYTFNGWLNESGEPIHLVSGEETYIAQYSEIDVTSLSAYIKIVIPDSYYYDDYTFNFNYEVVAGKTIEVNWGDGTTDATSSHTYSKPGTYDVKIKNVTSVSDHLCKGLDYISEIYLGDSITKVGDSAFANNTYLKSAIIGKNVTLIDRAAFAGCGSLVSVIIKSNVLTTIAAQVFEACDSLVSINIPESVTTIGDYAFRGTSLSSVIIPKNVTLIGEYAFAICSSLASISIPSSVTSIGKCVIIGCPALVEIKIDTKNTTYDSRDNCNGIVAKKDIEDEYGDIIYPEGALIAGCKTTDLSKVKSIGKYAFQKCTSLTSVVISKNITSIGDNAFEGCTSLASVTFEKGLTSIGDSAFSMCYYITSIKIPDSVTSIGEKAFYQNTYLESIEISDNVSTIGESAFVECLSLTSIKLPKSLTKIEYNIFRSCFFLESVSIPGSVTEIDAPFGTCFSLWDVDLTAFENLDAIPTCKVGTFDYCSYDLKLKVKSEAMADAFIAKGGGWAIDKSYYTWPQ